METQSARGGRTMICHRVPRGWNGSFTEPCFICGFQINKVCIYKARHPPSIYDYLVSSADTYAARGASPFAPAREFCRPFCCISIILVDRCLSLLLRRHESNSHREQAKQDSYLKIKERKDVFNRSKSRNTKRTCHKQSERQDCNG